MMMLDQKLRRNTMLVTALVVLPLVTGCHFHSPFREELAKDIQSRYKLVSPSALQALEVLDSDINKLLDSQRADFEVYRETSEQVLLNMKWSEYKRAVKTLEDSYFKSNGDEQGRVADVAKGIETAEKAVKDLKVAIDALDQVLKSLNTALKKAEEKTSLAEDLEGTKKTITAALTAIHAAVQKEPNSPLAKRLSSSVGEIDKYIKQLSEDEMKKGDKKRVFSLVVEAMRLGRDVTALEKEAVEQEQSYHERVLALYEVEKKILPKKKELANMRGRYGDIPLFPGAQKFPDDEMIRERLNILARQISQDEEAASTSEDQMSEQYRKAAENDQRARNLEASARLSRGRTKSVAFRAAEELRSHSRALRMEAGSRQGDARIRRIRANADREIMRQILDDIARYQAINLTNEMRVKELELRRASEKYRNAKLKDVIYERQRITLISYGLDGVVRYSESGLRAQDINSLISIARMVAEFIIAARV